jgi:hypothetical protein
MNPNHLKLLAASTFLGVASFGHGQGWITWCDDPSTTAALYSTSYAGNAVGNELFGASLPVSGTVQYELCGAPPPFTANAAGGLGFFTGPTASMQTSDDDLLALTMGGGFFFGRLPNGTPIFGSSGSAADWAYAAIARQADDETTPTLTRIDSVQSFFVGASDRYMISEWNEDNTLIEWRTDVIGDAARVQWTMTNTDADATNIGLWFGQWVNPISDFGNSPGTGIGFVNVPGYKPLTVHRRFQRNPDLDPNLNPREYPMPAYTDFEVSQSSAWQGMRVINDSTDSTGAFPDQSPVDGFDIGLPGFLLGDQYVNDQVFPDALHDDIETDGAIAYIQKWNPTPVAGTDQPVANRRRQIVSYYKTTWGDSSFSPPYNIVADSGKVIAVQDNAPFNFVRSPQTIRTYIDNTRGFTSVDKEIQLENVLVTLDLPQGLGAAGNLSQHTITRSIGRVNPKQIKFTDFQIAADPTAFGVKTFTITVQPQPGPVKTITGQIVIASQPYLQITDAANLVTAPWNFRNGSWANILGGTTDPLRPDIDYQAIAWDATTQQYVLSTGPTRGFGNWLLSTKDVGFKALNGGPTTPSDLGSGAPLIDLKPGWNLIANPYNYPIPIGQIVGVPGSDNTHSYSYQELVQRGALTNSFAYWDPGTQSYSFLGENTDLLQPNQGYWVNVTDSLGLTLAYPPVFTPFIPAGSGGVNSNSFATKVYDRSSIWSLDLVAKQGRRQDRSNTLGLIAKNLSPVRTRVYEPPMSPQKNAISAAFEVDSKKGTMRLAKSLVSDGELRNFNFGVYTKQAGEVTVSWPRIGKVPSKYSLVLRDTVTGQKVDMRTATSYTFRGGDRSNRVLKISVTSLPAPLVEKLEVTRTGGNDSPASLSYYVSGDVSTTVKILQDNKLVRTIAKKVEQSEGLQETTWNLKADGTKVAAGWYKAEVTVTDGQHTDVQSVKFKVQ